MKRFLSAFFSWQTLAFAGLLLLAAAVWFVGPLVAFGGARPLEPAGARVTIIVLLLVSLLFVLLRWPVSVIGVTALCLLIWHAGPLVEIGSTAPLGPAWVRALAIAVIVLGYGIYGLYRLWQALRADEHLLKKILHPSRGSAKVVAKDEIHALGNVVQRAMRQLKQMRTGATGFSKLFEGKRYIYELPWYMIVGMPGAGKTTALLNSGLKFPLAEQMGAASLRGAAGTANCDWWFTNDAVLIDTAGRYTTQDEQQDADKAAVNAAEWKGFLGLLRKHRPRAPINGALLTISVADLLGQSEQARIATAAAYRARLAELRSELGIRFPVYVMVTKMDLLGGFEAYFQSLTGEGRLQVWGFTLPYANETAALHRDGIRNTCANELRLLGDRLEAGLTNRLHEEYDGERRRKLYVLPQEFGGLAAMLAQFIEQVFLDSKFDDTQLFTTLRGVYFTSAAQANANVVADSGTLLQRLRGKFAPAVGMPGANAAAAKVLPSGNRSYFVHDMLHRLVIPESHLVRPNLRWETRFRLLRAIGHVLAVTLFVWLAWSLRTSFENNGDYLAAVRRKADDLTARVTQLYKEPKPEVVPDVLTDARYLPTFPGLNLNDPAAGFLYGLYTAPRVVDASGQTYRLLQDHLLLPHVVRRIETVLTDAVAAKDEKAAYEALRVYLQLHDPDRFNAGDVKAWVLRDWERADSAAAFGGRASMISHVEQLFSGNRVVQSPFVKNEDLIRTARAFLDGRTSTDRLYERAKAAMQQQAPEEFTLTRAVGPDVGTTFTRASGQPVDRGIPGLFTYAGYHEVFNKHLAEFVAEAQGDDAWVMGRNVSTAQKKTLDAIANRGDDPLTRAIRQLYLNEYAQRWDAFLGDIRVVIGPNLTFNLQVLRALAAPDSPLARLAKAAATETTLSHTVDVGEKSLAKKALSAVNGNAADAIESGIGIRPEERYERQFVDNRFAALREIVTGSADPAGGTGGATADGAQLAGLSALINEYYTALTIADTALASNSAPPAGTVGDKLKLTAATLPAPFKQLLTDLVIQNTRTLNQGVGELLARQMNAAIGNECRRAIEGKYPFASSSQEVDPEDFARVFASGGLLDEFFQKTLAPYVDTAANPWRYKLDSPDTPPVAGPSLEPFQRAAAIREVFFREPGAKKLAWKMQAKVVTLDPEITQLTIDIDGQNQLYSHGPVTPLAVTWPGPRGGSMAQLTAEPRVRPDTSTLEVTGPWALFHLLERGKTIGTVSADRLDEEFRFDGRKAVLQLSTGSLPNPLTTHLLKDFKCPGGAG
ncbi:type VI secretion system membrane subunit TssM [Burkholderia pyrrocinia]|uniref:type VI secretion system membrane subunit TssM n=1 Tax=Burkholderia pyrrocinia TaxID=60550 RepID=UPI00201B948E|nr:type VI secretion system membrane subunit TssM [Burkholderia pyrrocinia]